jgi:hypothetical protein
VTAAAAELSAFLVGTLGLSLVGGLVLAGGLATPAGGAEIEDAIDCGADQGVLSRGRLCSVWTVCTELGAEESEEE